MFGDFIHWILYEPQAVVLLVIIGVGALCYSVGKDRGREEAEKEAAIEAERAEFEAWKDQLP